jgi:hypothetical protein
VILYPRSLVDEALYAATSPEEAIAVMQINPPYRLRPVS